MKKMRRVLGIVLATMMVLAMGLTASAASTTSNLTINSKTGNHTYEVYQLLTGTFETLNGKNVLTNEAFGTGVTDALKTEYGNDAYKFLEAIDGKTGDEVLALVAGKIQSPVTVTDPYSLRGLAKGYYLIKDQDNTLDETHDAYTKYILRVVDEDVENVVAKMDIPEVEKKVKETNDTTGAITNWQDGADYDIGDKVPFQLSTKVIDGEVEVNGQMVKVFDTYKTYELIFHDQMSKGLTFVPGSVRVYKNGVLLAGGYNITAPVKDVNGENSELVISFADIKAAPVNAVAGDVITVEFEAELNQDAVIGSMGNPNKVYLEFSNNPNDDGNGKPGKTPEDKVIVFTYELDVNKTDKEGKALQGAGFSLYKEVPAGTAGAVVIDGKNYVQIGQEITGVTTFEFKGIDAGNYRLVETTVPAGYNKAQDITFTVAATYETLADDPKLLTLEVTNVDPATAQFSADMSTGICETDVVNNQGIELPETGGIGTTIFYVIGAALMIGAGVVLVTRRRMSR